MMPLPQIDLSWTVDYYLERISIKLAELFGAFSTFFILLFIVMAFFSLLLWLVLPYIELRKTNLLQKIYHQLVESKHLLVSLDRRLSEREEKSDNSFED